jgi:two-component system C4-dicarboxylate transport response regulator DctD
MAEPVGFEVQLFSRAEDCLAQLPAHFPGVILSDVRMPGLSGLQLLAEVQRRDADLPVILLTGHGDVPMAVEAMRDGAYDFLEKPFSPDALLGSLRRALDKRRLVLETAACMNRPTIARSSNPACSACPVACRPAPAGAGPGQPAGQRADPWRNRQRQGAGRPLPARFRPARDKPFVALNCAAIPEQLFEAELFGHESGAFTGAQGKRIGKLEYADGGTLFLDEIESMPLAQQVKLLRVLQEQKLERLGPTRAFGRPAHHCRDQAGPAGRGPRRAFSRRPGVSPERRRAAPAAAARSARRHPAAVRSLRPQRRRAPGPQRRTAERRAIGAPAQPRLAGQCA